MSLCGSLARLKALDEQYAASLVVNDWYRLKRALQICTLSGRCFSSIVSTCTDTNVTLFPQNSDFVQKRRQGHRRYAK